MNSIVGTIFQPGAIEFHHHRNEWAFELVKSQSGAGAPPRVLFDPKKVNIELEYSSKVNPDDFPWVKRVEDLLMTADKVYLKPETDCLRFMQAIHDFGNRQQLITLGNQADVNAFGKRFWSNIRFLFAHRMDDFRFTIGKFVTNKINDEKKTRRIEIKSRMVPAEDGALPGISFDATGHDAPPQLVEWRKSTELNKACRFAVDDHHIELRVGLNRQPFSFLHEYREEFKNHSFTFERAALEAKLKKVLKRRTEVNSE